MKSATQQPGSSTGPWIAVTLLAVVIGVAAIWIAGNSPGGLASGPAATSRGPTVAAGDSGSRPSPASEVTSDLVVPTIQRQDEFENGRSYGRPEAPATLTIWADFQCPFCGKFTTLTEPRLIADYVQAGRLRIVYRDWVFIGVESVFAAVAARCASVQGAFWPYHDYLMANQRGENKGGFSDDRLQAIAKALQLDLDAFVTCTLDPVQQAAVRSESEAGDADGITQTPTLVIDGQVMAGTPTADADYQRLRAIIDRSIAAHAANQVPASPS